MKRVHGVIRIARVLTLIGVFSLLANSQATAQLLNLKPPTYPNFSAAYLTVQYTTNNGIFEATGNAYDYADTYVDPNTNETDWVGADFNLTAYITSTGNLTNGTLTIAGDLGDGNGYTDLLTGSLTTGAEGTAFGATNDVHTAAEFQFLFTITGGTLASDYGGVNAPVGYFDFFPDGSSKPFSGSWTSDFNNDGAGYGDVQAVPEPSSFLLLLFAGALCAAASILRRPRRRAS